LLKAWIVKSVSLDLLFYFNNFIAYAWEDHRKKVETFEKEGKILFGGNSVNRESLYLLFNCKDETIPYDFIKSVKKHFEYLFQI